MSSTNFDVAFLSQETLEAQPAPIASRGAVGWLRHNLFSSPLNAVLTLLAILLIAAVIPPIVRFVFVNAIWDGLGRDACIEDKVGHPVGACWAFVGSRLSYFIYGQYPFAERWRVNIYFALEIVGVAWLLWPRIGAKAWGLVYLIVVFPLLAFWLLSGGWGLAPVDTNLWGGMLVTLVVATVGIIFSLPAGVVLALGRRSTMPVAKILSVVFIEFVRGVPLITVLFMANVMLPLFLPEGSQPDKLLRALVAVALFSAAYMAEVVRGGLQAIPKGQHEGAMALGLGYPHRLAFIILPQALKMVIPGIVNSIISLFKDTTLVAAVAIFDFLKTIEASAQDAAWATPVTLYSGYAFAAMVYWLFCFSMSRYSQWVERRLDTGHKR
ncbi:amino acid ABC transporter permease [Labrys wisconsinensis]|uniref:General L-amino acid transport system permease protein n=1 Tax=Labrys wisconsinensis TaxID=425677 RepID=A0ABU0J270_9HYPH|nr:amino acid ABC transporter permease [Labrys wisconsinensis]MDQ0468334.1 general L-amino acid transport system permease protein [Labrys wisconsinensis]